MGAKIIFIMCIGFVAANYRNDGGFLPSSNYQRTEDQLAEPSARVEKSRDERDDPNDRTQRFGLTGYGSTGPYGGTAPGVYGPVKIDLGGVLLGSILGFGAVIILPKIIHAFSYGYGGYGRSMYTRNIFYDDFRAVAGPSWMRVVGDRPSWRSLKDAYVQQWTNKGVESDFLQVSDVINKMDEALSRYNIDSTSCMQRLACSYVQLANENMVNGNATDFDALLANVSSNSLVRRMLDGTSIYEAMNVGKSADTDCQNQYSKCKMEKKTIVKILTQVLPS